MECTKLKPEVLLRVGAGSRPAESGRTFARGLSVTCLGMIVVLLAGCRLDMHIQPKYLPYEPTSFFADGRSERQPVPGTVARGELRVDELLYSGTENGAESNRFPFPITRADLERGRERYNIYCTPCHDYTGSGRGMIVQRGFPQPPSYHIQRLRDAPVGHFYQVMTNGFGAMYSYAARITPADRWRIAAYIRVLQLSENATVNDVPEAERTKLMAQSAKTGTQTSAQQAAAPASGRSE
jgi:Cytochrome C oxidase, cbb3-type, subunit III